MCRLSVVATCCSCVGGKNIRDRPFCPTTRERRGEATVSRMTGRHRHAVTLDIRNRSRRLLIWHQVLAAQVCSLDVASCLRDRSQGPEQARNVAYVCPVTLSVENKAQLGSRSVSACFSSSRDLAAASRCIMHELASCILARRRIGPRKKNRASARPVSLLGSR